jgi:adenosylhomocysteine nucleosidase
MEGAAIAQVCYLNDVPFVIIRAISDKADGSSSMDYEEFKKKAAERSSAAVLYLLENESP